MIDPEVQDVLNTLQSDIADHDKRIVVLELKIRARDSVINDAQSKAASARETAAAIDTRVRALEGVTATQPAQPVLP